ncbi:flagellar basal-body rod protein FlgG [Candidatus Saganbacteria bacterium CG08_land_8_20_14_0_20_45_16]|uniref:Flagellar basal-body rod protein FlgG n=1 Tax=Candidatus Saganbacteria bacterium CG08_land_8_20_14_0_20_45_16 TaxID=2014293 RepID=A0A2H0XYV3_UNCSA|nr:MAG: flagellar basal-body rod protein FlgG [Candidatus Saganbacteria bacterium CG08_land_8_20_14_0_20_45_16]
MFQPLYVAATGLSAMQDEILNITNDLSNAKTVAFKKSRTEMESLYYIQKSFKDTLSEAMSDLEMPKVNLEFGTGVRVAATSRDFTQGSVEITNNPLDLAIKGEGFFAVKMPDGTIAYCRAGNLHIDNDANLVDPNGHKLEPEISIPEGTTSITIQQDGTVLVAVNNESTFSEIGQIAIARFTNPSGLKTLGQNLYAATETSGESMLGIAGADGFGSINQYALEQSNVDVISEMMKMVIVQRVFDTVTKAVQSYEGMLASLEKMKQ